MILRIKMKKYTFSSIWLFCIVLFLSACSPSRPPAESAAIKFTEKIYSGDVEGVMALTNLDLSGLPANKGVFALKIRNLILKEKQKADMYGGINKITVVSASYKSREGKIIDQTKTTAGSKAYIKLNILFHNGMVHQKDLVLIDISGEWKIAI